MQCIYPKKHNNEKPLEYVATYNKNDPELFTERIKNPEELKTNEILDTTKIIRSRGQSKNLKRILTSSTYGENTTQGVTKCNNKRCKIYDIIIEGKSYIFKTRKQNSK